MNYNFLIIALICAFSFKANSQSEEYKIDRVMDEYFDVLKEEGYAPSYDEDKDIKFKIEGSLYYIIRPSYDYHINLSKYYSHEDGCDLKTLNAVNYASRSTRYAKAYLTPNCDRVVIKSALYNNGASVEEIVNQAIAAVKYCSNKFREKYNE